RDWSSDVCSSDLTSTPAAEVWIRPWDSVTGTRWTRCTPPSYFSCAHTPSAGSSIDFDLTAIEMSLYPPRSDSVASRIWVPQPFRSEERRNVRATSQAASGDYC